MVQIDLYNINLISPYDSAPSLTSYWIYLAPVLVLCSPDTLTLPPKSVNLWSAVWLPKYIGVQNISFLGNNNYFRSDLLFVLLPLFDAHLYLLLWSATYRFFPFCENCALIRGTTDFPCNFR